MAILTASQGIQQHSSCVHGTMSLKKRHQFNIEVRLEFCKVQNKGKNFVESTVL
jgi:hypothetical protein